MSKDGKFELVSPQTAAIEKRLAKHKQTIQTCLNGEIRGQIQSRFYRALSGIALAAAKETIEHGNANPEGGFLKWIEAEFPDITERNAQKRMEFGRAVVEKSANLAYFKKHPLKLKKTLSKEEEKALREFLPDLMDGKGEVEWLRDIKLLKQPKEAGGFRPPTEVLEAWLKEKHPELAGKGWDELTDAVQREFIADDMMKGPRLTPEAAAKQVEVQRAQFTETLIGMTTGKWILRIDADARAVLKMHLQQALDRLNKLENAKEQ